MNYRRDLDGIRALAVIAVIGFHCNLSIFSGGYVGVDIFFVISGYLITDQIYTEIRRNTFTFRSFYKRRLARLLPALLLTLICVLGYGFVFFDVKAFDNLGKEIVFSTLGIANLLFAQGRNYFATDPSEQPLLHLWSLGVEEQFYVILPLTLIILSRFTVKAVLPALFLVASLSLFLSISAANNKEIKGYYLLHYRAFELLIGSILAISWHHAPYLYRRLRNNPYLSIVAAILMLAPIVTLTKDSVFPSYNALWPCIGTALLIASQPKGIILSILTTRIATYIGLISYPLYLFHQPIISLIKRINQDISNHHMFFLTFLSGTLVSGIVYKYVETPIRHAVKHNSPTTGNKIIASLGAIAIIIAIIGTYIAKSGGMNSRFHLINPFALDIIDAHSPGYYDGFKRGMNVKPSNQSKALFIGDSVLQRYITPIANSLNWEFSSIDTITRGGCVLLKGAMYDDIYSDISCTDLRNAIYDSQKKYEYVVISQSWDFYQKNLHNLNKEYEDLRRWNQLLQNTIDHFAANTKHIILIGAHPSLSHTEDIQPSLSLTQSKYAENLEKIKISNIENLKQSLGAFSSINTTNDVSITIIEPYHIFCASDCVTHDRKWSYFSDNIHITNHAYPFIQQQIDTLLKDQRIGI